MTLYCIWCQGSSFEEKGRVEYPFIAITPRFTLTPSDRLLETNLWVKWIYLKIIGIQDECFILPNCKLFVSRIVTWSYDYFPKIFIINNLKP